ncbi:MAG TPA: ribonuclease III [Chthonomonas sp.]|uniref:ribonuclease III n=1 Tax=Chthonomonas sp. TaxID=2282153 RepID=UPI002B4B87B1|nr:ribonuclease III [Chthonomonas sp.]HLI48297.1 ribonuclease III [Chthonomonas sp.]
MTDSEQLTENSNVLPIEKLQQLERRLGVDFRRKELLAQAITHRSAVSSHQLQSNERLEFLGDAIIGLIVVEWLFKHHPDVKEGILAKAKAYAVSEQALAEAARRLGIEEFVVVAYPESILEGRGGRAILADAFEAIVAALYLDRGLRATKKFVEKAMADIIQEAIKESHRRDYKSTLQELVQAQYRLTPVYRIRTEYGSDHDKTFEAEVLLHGRPLGHGVGKSKKEAEQEAARAALAHWSQIESDNKNT